MLNISIMVMMPSMLMVLIVSIGDSLIWFLSKFMFFRWQMLQHLLLVRCQPSSKTDMRTLVGMVAAQGVHKVLELLNRVVGMLGDPVEVEGGQLSRQMHLWRLLLLFISHLSYSQREGEKRRVMIGLSRCESNFDSCW